MAKIKGKKMVIPNAAENIEKLNQSYIAGGNASATLEKSFKISYKENRLADLWPQTGFILLRVHVETDQREGEIESGYLFLQISYFRFLGTYPSFLSYDTLHISVSLSLILLLSLSSQLCFDNHILPCPSMTSCSDDGSLLPHLSCAHLSYHFDFVLLIPCLTHRLAHRGIS